MLIGRLMWVYYQQISNCCRPVLTYWLTHWRRQWLTDCWSCTAFCCDSFSLFRQLCTVGHGIFLHGRCKQLFVSELNNAYFSTHLFYNSVWVTNSCITVSFSNSLRIAIFLNTDISQGSVATRLGCGGVFKYDVVTNFLLSLTVKEFWKSLNIWWSYGQEFGVLFSFDSQCTYV